MKLILLFYFYLADENIRQLQGIQETIQRMRESSLVVKVSVQCQLSSHYTSMGKQISEIIGNRYYIYIEIQNPKALKRLSVYT